MWMGLFLGSTITKDDNEESDVTRRIQAGWKKWRKVSGVLCGRRMPVKVKGKIHKTGVRPVKMYGIEGTPIKKVNVKRMGVAEMKMLRWLSEVTRRDRISVTPIKGIVKVTEVSKKMQKQN